MALALDKHILSQPDIRDLFEYKLDFVGTFLDWNTDELDECTTSSKWSECTVNAYHLCAQHVPSVHDPYAWMRYSRCFFSKQYPVSQTDPNYLECASPNPRGFPVCSTASFPGIAAKLSDECAMEAGLIPAELRSCIKSGQGLALLKESFNHTYFFPRNKNNQIEPQWIEVDGPDDNTCDGGWDKCMSYFDKTDCPEWSNCDPDAWAQHIRDIACDRFGAQVNSSSCPQNKGYSVQQLVA